MKKQIQNERRNKNQNESSTRQNHLTNMQRQKADQYYSLVDTYARKEQAIRVKITLRQLTKYWILISLDTEKNMSKRPLIALFNLTFPLSWSDTKCQQEAQCFVLQMNEEKCIDFQASLIQVPFRILQVFPYLICKSLRKFEAQSRSTSIFTRLKSYLQV